MLCETDIYPRLLLLCRVTQRLGLPCAGHLCCICLSLSFSFTASQELIGHVNPGSSNSDLCPPDVTADLERFSMLPILCAVGGGLEAFIPWLFLIVDDSVHCTKNVKQKAVVMAVVSQMVFLQ